MSAKNEIYNLDVDLGQWSVELATLRRVENTLQDGLDERRILSFKCQMASLDIYKTKSLAIKLITKILGESHNIFLTVSELETFVRFYDPVADLVDNSELHMAPDGSTTNTKREQQVLKVYIEALSRLMLRILNYCRPRKPVRNDCQWQPKLWNCVRTWKQPCGRKHHTTTPIGPDARYLVMFGGENYHASKDACSGACVVLDTRSSQWRAVPMPRPITRRLGHTSLWWSDYSQCDGGGLLVFGGLGPSRVYSNALLVLGIPKFHADPPRPDPETGKLLFKEDFVSKFGGTAEWKAQHPSKLATIAKERRCKLAVQSRQNSFSKI